MVGVPVRCSALPYVDVLLEQLPQLVVASIVLTAVVVLVLRLLILPRELPTSFTIPFTHLPRWITSVVGIAVMGGAVGVAAHYVIREATLSPRPQQESTTQKAAPVFEDKAPAAIPPGIRETPPLRPIAEPEAPGEDLVVPNTYQSFNRGTVHSLHPDRRMVNIVWEDLGRVKMRAAELVTNYNQLKVGQIIESSWFDYVDVLIAKDTPEAEAKAQALLAKGARLEGIPGSQERVKLWSMSGMVTKVDPATGSLFIINASNGKPDDPSPERGEVIQMPQVQSAAGKQALAAIKPGDQVLTVYTQATAVKVTIVR